MKKRGSNSKKEYFENILTLNPFLMSITNNFQRSPREEKSVLDTYRIRARIEEINRRLRMLNRDFKPLSEKELTGNETLNAAAERHLQIAVQACLDISNHLIASLGLQRPSEKVSEVFNILATESLIPANLAKRMVRTTGYRNVAVHDYLDVDRHQTYVNIQKHLPDLSLFAKYIEEFLEKQTKKTR